MISSAGSNKQQVAAVSKSRQVSRKYAVAAVRGQCWGQKVIDNNCINYQLVNGKFYFLQCKKTHTHTHTYARAHTMTSSTSAHIPVLIKRRNGLKQKVTMGSQQWLFKKIYFHDIFYVAIFWCLLNFSSWHHDITILYISKKKKGWLFFVFFLLCDLVCGRLFLASSSLVSMVTASPSFFPIPKSGRPSNPLKQTLAC